MELRVLRTPPRSPKADSLCERAIRTLRREYLDFLIPVTENHLQLLMQHWVTHYNPADPTPALGQGSQIRQPIVLSLRTNTGIAFQATLGLLQTLFSVAYTMNIAW
jgi:hypothetical protein